MCNCNGQKNSDVSSVALALLPAATKDKWIINASMKFLGCILSFVLSYFSCLVTLKSNSKTQADEKALKKSFIALAIYGQIKVWFCAMFQFDQSFASISLKEGPDSEPASERRDLRRSQFWSSQRLQKFDENCGVHFENLQLKCTSHGLQLGLLLTATSIPVLP